MLPKIHSKETIQNNNINISNQIKLSITKYFYLSKIMDKNNSLNFKEWLTTMEFNNLKQQFFSTVKTVYQNRWQFIFIFDIKSFQQMFS